MTEPCKAGFLFFNVISPCVKPLGHDGQHESTGADTYKNTTKRLRWNDIKRKAPTQRSDFTPHTEAKP